MRMIKKKIYFISRSSLKKIGFLGFYPIPAAVASPKPLIKYLNNQSESQVFDLFKFFKKVENGGYLAKTMEKPGYSGFPDILERNFLTS